MRQDPTTEHIQHRFATATAPAEEFAEMDGSTRRRVFFQLPESLQREIVGGLSDEQLRHFASHVDPDEAADLLGLVDDETRSQVVEQLGEARREKVAFLLDFSPESAAGMMDLDYVTVESDRTFEEVARRVQSHEQKTGRFPTVYVTENGNLVGDLPGHTLALRDQESASLRDYVRPAPSVSYDRDEEEVVRVFREHPNRRIAVLDDDGSILGVIHADDLLRAVEQQAGETLYEFTGVAEEEGVLDGPLSKVQSRYKWLLLNLATAFLAAAVVGLFEETIQAFTLLAVYMPIVAGMGGNAGTQSMAVTVRGIALEQVSLAVGGRVILNEVFAGAANGVITGIVVAVIAALVNQNPMFGGVLAVSMVLNLVIAGFFGALIPMILDRLELDPATSATIFITTATDVLGFFIFLGLAQVMLV